VNDYSGQPVGDTEEGYLIKEEEAQNSLMPLDLRRLPILIFDEKKDNPNQIRESLVGRLKLMREHYEMRVDEVAQTIVKISENIQDAQASAAFEDIFKEIATWVKRHETTSSQPDKVQEELLNAIAETHASSVRASANRRGTWYNLDYYHQIGSGARYECVKILKALIGDLKSIVYNKLERQDLAPTHKFLRELLHFIDSEADQIYKDAQIIGHTVFKNPLESNGAFWGDLQSQWGQGPGYKNRISRRTDDWFDIGKRRHEVEILGKHLTEKIRELVKTIEVLTEGAREAS
jgi:hypothetical protein